MPSKNSLTIEGHLGQDAKSFVTSKGTPGCNLSVGVTSKGMGGSPETTWVKVTLWKDAAEKAKELLKGQAIRCEGRASAEAYLGRDGKPKANLLLTAFHFELLEKKDEKSKSPSQPQHIEDEMNLDDIPF